MELKLGSIPFKIHGRFFLMALLLGMNERNPAKLVVWVAIVLVSVTIHELGHALMGKAFGLLPRIDLHGMGGLTSWIGTVDAQKGGDRGKLSTGKSIAISLAGPFAGFLFALVVFIARVAGFHPTHPLAGYAVSLLLIVNVVWGIFNLLPMLPLDGGNVMRSVLLAITDKNGDKASRIVSIVIAAALGLYALTRQEWWILYLAVLYGFQNVQAIRQQDGQQADQSLADAIEQSYAALDRHEPKEAVALLAPALASESSSAQQPEIRQVGVRIYVVALMKTMQWDEAIDVITRERKNVAREDLDRYAQALRDVGRDNDADKISALNAAPALSEFRA